MTRSEIDFNKEVFIPSKHRNCPNCNEKMSYTKYNKKYSHWLMVEYRGVYDGVVAYQCDVCKKMFDRFGKKKK